MSRTAFNQSGTAPTPGNPAEIRRRFLFVVMGLLIAGLAVFLVRITGGGAAAANSVVLPDGSIFKLDAVVVDTGYNYQYKSGPAWAQRFAPIIPDFIESKFLNIASGGFSFGGDETNLIFMTVLEKASVQSKLRPERLRISDDQGNAFDSNWGANSFTMNRLLVNGWQVPAFPRRTPQLTAQFLARDTDKQWVELASFTIENPIIAEGERWNPESMPVSRSDGDLAIRLERFISGVVPHDADALNPLSPRLTQLSFSFAVDGQPADYFNVEEVTLADAPGNRWHPHLDLLVRTGNNWAQDGEVQFLGALWPGETAWRIEVKAYQTAEFKPDRIWDVELLPLPEAGSDVELTNRFSIGGATLQLANLLAPGVEITNEWKWVVRYWGKEPSVYSLGLHVLEGIGGGHRIVLAGAWNENGDPVRLVEQRGWDQERQALFFSIPQDSRSLRLKFGVSEVKRVEFLARPDFVGSAGADA